MHAGASVRVMETEWWREQVTVFKGCRHNFSCALVHTRWPKVQILESRSSGKLLLGYNLLKDLTELVRKLDWKVTCWSDLLKSEEHLLTRIRWWLNYMAGKTSSQVWYLIYFFVFLRSWKAPGFLTLLFTPLFTLIVMLRKTESKSLLRTVGHSPPRST